MSITARYVRLPVDKWQSLLQLSQEEFDDYQVPLIGNAIDTVGVMSLSGDWQAVHFLLTGKIAYIDSDKIREVTTEPLESIVMGGVDTRFASVYGFVRYLPPALVKICSTELDRVTEAHYSARLIPSVFNDAHIFPYGGSNPWSEERLEILPDVIEGVKWFFGCARQEGQAILINL